MSWQDLVCATCGGRVAEARCATCRVARDHFQAQRVSLPAGPLLVLAALLFVLLVVLVR